MNSKNIKRVLILIILNVLILCVSVSFAYEKINPPDYAVDTGSIGGTTKITSMANNIVAIIRLIGSIISVIMLVWMGIRYMSASVEEKAQYKETLKPYFIGAIMLFGITNILAIISDIISKL